MAATYPFQLCRAILEGISEQMVADTGAAPDAVLRALRDGGACVSLEMEEEKRIGVLGIPAAEEVHLEGDLLEEGGSRFGDEEENLK